MAGRVGVRATGIVLAYAILCIIVLVPLWSVPILCLGDYLNHLARIHVLTTIGHSPDLQRYFDARWRAVPYYGMDLPIALLARIFGLYQAGRVFVGLCLLMPVIAAAALRLAAYGRIGLAPALGFCISYNFVLAFGFLNYLFCACCAVMLFAAWIATPAWPPVRRCAVFMAGCLVLYMGHPFALGAYAVLVVFHEAGAAGWGSPWRVIRRVAIATYPLAAPIAFRLMVEERSRGMGVSNTYYGAFDAHAASMISPVYFPGSELATLILAALAIAGAAWLVIAARPRAGLSLAIGGLALVALLTPHVLMNMSAADIRLPFVLLLLLIGAVPLQAARARWSGAVFVLLVACLAGDRAADAGIMLHHLRGQVRDVRTILSALPRGSRMLAVDSDLPEPGRDAPPFMNRQLPLLATIDRDALVPFLFTEPTPVRVLPAYGRMTSPFARAVTMDQLSSGTTMAGSANLTPYGDGGHVYWAGWPRNFDYVLVMHFAARQSALPSFLHEIASGDIATLYRVDGEAALSSRPGGSHG